MTLTLTDTCQMNQWSRNITLFSNFTKVPYHWPLLADLDPDFGHQPQRTHNYEAMRRPAHHSASRLISIPCPHDLTCPEISRGNMCMYILGLECIIGVPVRTRTAPCTRRPGPQYSKSVACELVRTRSLLQRGTAIVRAGRPGSSFLTETRVVQSGPSWDCA